MRELVLGGLESGALVERSEVWHLEDRLPSTTRLVDLVEQLAWGYRDAEQARGRALTVFEDAYGPDHFEVAMPTPTSRSCAATRDTGGPRRRGAAGQCGSSKPFSGRTTPRSA